MSSDSKKTVTINEFSRAFDKLEKEKGKLISGSYGTDKEFDGETRPIPDDLKTKVQDIALDDNYPPEAESYGLIAFEDEKYALLSVATSLDDNKDRTTIAYRYFWLDKKEVEDQDFDGIETLLNWWYEQENPEFNWYERLEDSSLYQAQVYWKKPEENKQEEPTKLIVIPTSTLMPIQATEEADDNYDNLTEHGLQNSINSLTTLTKFTIELPFSNNKNYLSNYINPQNNNYALAKTENKPKSDENKEKQQTTELISVPQVTTCNKNSDKILNFHQEAIKLQQQTDKPQLIWAYDVKRLNNPQYFTLIACSDEESKNWTKDKTSNNLNKNQPNLTIEKQKEIKKISENVKKLFNEIIKNSSKEELKQYFQDTEKKENLIMLLSTHSDWNWDLINQNNQFNSPLSNAKYRALLGLFQPEGLDQWLDWLYQQKSSGFSFNKYPNKKFAKECLELQKIIYLTIKSLKKSNDYNQNYKIYTNLERHLQLEISHILDKLKDKDYDYFAQVKWLLIDSKSIWSFIFKTYTSYTYKYLMGEKDKIQEDEFLSYLEEIRNARKSKNQKSLEKSHYYAQLYRQVRSNKSEAKALADNFEEWGEGNNGQKPSTNNQRNQDPQKNVANIIMIVLSVGIIVVVGIASYLIFSKSAQEQKPSYPKKELTMEDNLEKQLYLQQESQEISQSSRKKTIRLLEDLKKKTSESKTNKDYLENPNYQTLKKQFLPNIPETFEITEKNLSGKDFNTLIELLKKGDFLEKNFSEYSENAEVKLQTAVKAFQQQKKIEATGIVDQATWAALFGESQKVTDITNFLINLYQENRDYEQTIEVMERLKNCQDKTLDNYDQCWEDLKKSVKK